jgi:DNA-binding IclR family transcriptional regulator
VRNSKRNSGFNNACNSEGSMMTEYSKVPAADATLRILLHLAGQRGPVPASAIATALHLPRSTVYQLLAVLQDRGFVVHLPEERRYGLGVRSLELGGGYARQEPLARLGRMLIAALVDRVGESAHLAVLHGRDVVYAVEERAAHRPALVTGVGVRLPSHLTASGRALLAALPAAQVRALYPNGDAFADRTGRSPKTYRDLRGILQQTRQDGFASEDGEISEGIASIGVAVLDHVGWPAAGIAVTFPQQNIPRERWPELAVELDRTAAELGRRIRGRVA